MSRQVSRRARRVLRPVADDGHPAPAARQQAAWPERRLLIAALAGTDRPLAPERVAEEVAAGLDWDALLAQAERHRVVPLVDAALAPLRGTGAVPTAVEDTLRTRRAHTAAQAKLRAVELVRTLAILDDRGVDALAFKGPALALSAYGGLHRRQFGDLDVFVAPERMRTAVAALEAAGFRATEDLGWSVSLSDTRGRTHLDLHHRLLPAAFRDDLDFTRAWAARRTVDIEGAEVATFGPVHTVICACMQVAKDSWSQRLVFQKIADVAVLGRPSTPADLHAVAEEAVDLRLAGIVAVGIEHAGTLGWRPPALPRAIDATPRIRAYATESMLRLWAEDVVYPTSIVMAQRHRVLREHRWDGWAPFAARLVAEPTEADRTAVRLPRPLRFLYRGVRPVRLVAAHARRLVGRGRRSRRAAS